MISGTEGVGAASLRTGRAGASPPSRARRTAYVAAAGAPTCRLAPKYRRVKKSLQFMIKD
jgi:hypothetical protein